jgi:hypothetical protein
MKKATEFHDAAVRIEDEMPDASINLFVLAGIAAADVICCSQLGKYAVGQEHHEAVSLLGQAEREMEKYLRTLLSVKSKVAYTHRSATADERKKAGRAAEALLEAARRTSAPGGRQSD